MLSSGRQHRQIERRARYSCCYTATIHQDLTSSRCPPFFPPNPSLHHCGHRRAWATDTPGTRLLRRVTASRTRDQQNDKNDKNDKNETASRTRDQQPTNNNAPRTLGTTSRTRDQWKRLMWYSRRLISTWSPRHHLACWDYRRLQQSLLSCCAEHRIVISLLSCSAALFLPHRSRTTPPSPTPSRRCCGDAARRTGSSPPHSFPTPPTPYLPTQHPPHPT